MKYSAVIPTMLKSPRLKKLVEELQNHQLVDEVIIIDNSENLEPSLDPHPKQKCVFTSSVTCCTKQALPPQCGQFVIFSSIILFSI